MFAFLGSALAPYALKILGFLAAAGAVIAVLFGARQAGRAAEKVETMQQAVKVADERRKIEDNVARTGAAGRRDELRQWTRDDGDSVQRPDSDPANKG